jgi:chaperonin GroES
MDNSNALPLDSISTFVPKEYDVQPLFDYILVEPEYGAEMIGSIVVPESVREKKLLGKVVAHGPGRYENGTKINITVRKGDRIAYAANTYNEVELDGIKLYFVRERDILAIIERAKEDAEPNFPR